MALALVVAVVTVLVVGTQTGRCPGAAVEAAAGPCTTSPSDAARVLVALVGGLAVVVLLRQAVRARG